MRQEFAAAKVNLTLHITGQRADGFHLLDSLVMFADVGDSLEMSSGGKALTLQLEGPEAQGVPSDHSNSVMKVARDFLSDGTPTGFRLNKLLPSAAGIGGGTADAAAAVRLIAQAFPDSSAPRVDLAQLSAQDRLALCARLARFGADVPVCLLSRTARMRGIGEDVTPLPGLPNLHAILVNPRVSVSTPQVFSRIASKDNPPMPDIPATFANPAAFVAWIKEQRNDMQDAACAIAPQISTALALISQQKSCLLARMSGSGATCFGVFGTRQAAQAAASAVSQAQPDWWVRPCTFGDSVHSVS